MNKEDINKKYKKTYPNYGPYMHAFRSSYLNYKNMMSKHTKINEVRSIPKQYTVCNTSTIDSTFNLNILEGNLPKDINGNMYITQCLGTYDAFMVGDTNIVKIKFQDGYAAIKNKMLHTPVSIAKNSLQESVHKFHHMGLMYMSPGMGMFSYTEGMYLTPDGRLAVTSDVDRPWIINKTDLSIETPLGKREEYLPMMNGDALDIMGSLFAGYSNSHVIYTDTKTNELFLVNYQLKQKDNTHPCNLLKWDGKNDLEKYSVVDKDGKDIEIKQSIHELIFTKDYILLADTAFLTGPEIMCSWKNSPTPNSKTIVHIVKRKDLNPKNKVVTATTLEIDEPCIHLIADYENIDNMINIYMLHTPATNTAEIIRRYDKNLSGEKFPENAIGYGTLPVLDLSSLGKHTINMLEEKVDSSKYLRDSKYSFGPYMYTYMNRGLKNFTNQDLYVMYKGFKKELLPKRIYKAYKDVENRKIPIDDLISGKHDSNNTIVRLNKKDFTIDDIYTFDDDTLLYTISSINSDNKKDAGYILAAVVTNNIKKTSSGHEYWLFKADNLSNGPICKLGNVLLNNSVLFHTMYISNEEEIKLNKKEVVYNIDIKKDYPKKELEKWNKEVLEVFEQTIYPLFDKTKSTQVNNNLKELSKNRMPINIGSEYLIGEEEITDAPAFALRMIEEVKRMTITPGWGIVSNKNGLLIESKAINGPLENGVEITKMETILDVDANKFFEYMTSPVGYSIIDPVSDESDHSKEPLEVYEWKKNSRLEAAVANTDIFCLPPSDFVVLNAIDNTEKIFASKSIIHNKLPGASKYTTNETPKNGKTRAINTFAVKVEEHSDNKCKVTCINYADMCGNTTPSMNNYVNKKIFFQGLYKRMKKQIVNISK